MKITRLRPLVPAGFLTVLAAFVLAASAHGQADVTFSGGSGMLLTLTIDAPISYTVTYNNGYQGPVFALIAAGDLFRNGPVGFSGSITYTINGGAPIPLTRINSDYNGGDYFANDIYFDNPAQAATLPVGTVIVLNAGTDVTSSGVSYAPPASGSYQTYIGNDLAQHISQPGVAVPEPSTWALLVGGGVAGLGAATRQRRVRRA